MNKVKKKDWEALLEEKKGEEGNGQTVSFYADTLTLKLLGNMPDGKKSKLINKLIHLGASLITRQDLS